MIGYTPEEILQRNRKVKIIRKYIRIITIILLVPLMFFNIVIISTALSSPETTPNFFGYKIFIIMSGSMEPTFNLQDIIVVKKMPVDMIKEDDIIAFRDGNTVVTHRIKEIIEEGKYSTKGDNNNTQDSQTVKYEDVEGVYIFKIPKVGAVISFLKTGIGISIIIILIILLYRSEKNTEKVKKIRKEKRKQFEINKEKARIK